MDRRNIEKILEFIEAIEEKNTELENYISNLNIVSRNAMLKELTNDIISNNALLQELIEFEEQILSNEEIEKKSSDYIIEEHINKIQKEPYKKIIFLSDFLKLFQDKISEKDKEVILQSLKDEKDINTLRERMISLATTFKLNL
jgi:hypothetical protein